MTERLYYDHPMLWDFTSTVVSVRDTHPLRPKESGFWVALAESAFYPTSGGQPYDTGTLNALPVTDVEVDRDGVVWHKVEGALNPGDEVRGLIDGPRRLDHMEQHAGEHMIAGAIWELLRGTTIGLHLGQEFSTIDVTMPDGRMHFTPEEIAAVEDLVNRRIREDWPIRCFFPSEEELAALPLRKPPTVTEHVRIVAMGDFEMVACGGTHPASTGRIGHVKIISVTPSKGKARIAFVCGARADRLFRDTFISVTKAGNVLSAPADRIASAAGELKARLSSAEKELRKLQSENLLSVMTDHIDPESLPGVSLCVLSVPESDAAAVSEAVSSFVSEPSRALLLSFGERLTFARSENVDINMNELIRRVARGGGRPDLASGAGIPECTEVARKILVTEGKGKSWITSRK